MYKNTRRILLWYAPTHFNNKKLVFFVGEMYTKYNDVVCANNFGRDQKKHAKLIPKCISSNKNQQKSLRESFKNVTFLVSLLKCFRKSFSPKAQHRLNLIKTMKIKGNIANAAPNPFKSLNNPSKYKKYYNWRRVQGFRIN